MILPDLDLKPVLIPHHKGRKRLHLGTAPYSCPLFPELCFCSVSSLAGWAVVTRRRLCLQSWRRVCRGWVRTWSTVSSAPWEAPGRRSTTLRELTPPTHSCKPSWPWWPTRSNRKSRNSWKMPREMVSCAPKWLPPLNNNHSTYYAHLWWTCSQETLNQGDNHPFPCCAVNPNVICHKCLCSILYEARNDLCMFVCCSG